MVTIGPLIVLGVLGVTFRIGARPVAPIETDIPTIPAARSRPQSVANVLQTDGTLVSDPALHATNTTDGFSSPDASQVLELPRFGPALQRGRISEGSGDTMTLSRSEHPTTTATSFAGQHQSTGGERESLDGATASINDTETEHTRGVCRSSTSPVPEDMSLSKPQRSTGSVLETAPGKETDAEKVKHVCYSGGGVCLISVSYLSRNWSMIIIKAMHLSLCTTCVGHGLRLLVSPRTCSPQHLRVYRPYTDMM